MKQLFREIYDQLSTLKDLQNNPAYIRMWNNQLQLLEDGKMEMFQTPALFIEFVTANTNTLVGGEGVQLYEPLYINIHVLYWQMDASGALTGDGTFEQNLDVFDFKQTVYRTLQKFKTTKGVSMVRVSEKQDYEHAGVYHFIQSYVTNWVDELMQEPVDGGETIPPLALQLNLTREGSTDLSAPHIYNNQFFYIFNSGLAGNPASGRLQLNDTVPATVTAMYLNNIDRNSVPVGIGLIPPVPDINSLVKVFKDETNYAVYKITAILQAGGITTYTVTFVEGAGTFANNDNITFNT